MIGGLSTAWGDGHNLPEGESYAPLERIKRQTQIDAGDLALGDEEENTDGLTDWDLLLKDLQEDARNIIESETGKVFALYENQEFTLSGGSSILKIPRPPVQIHSITEDGKTVDPSDYHAKPSGQIVKTGVTNRQPATTSRYGSGRPYSATQSTDPKWSDGHGNITVNLDYGWQDPPGKVVTAETKLVDHALMGAVSKRDSPIVQVDDYQVEANIPVVMNEEVRGLLSGYDRRDMGG